MSLSELFAAITPDLTGAERGSVFGVLPDELREAMWASVECPSPAGAPPRHERKTDLRYIGHPLREFVGLIAHRGTAERAVA